MPALCSVGLEVGPVCLLGEVAGHQNAFLYGK